MASPALSLLRDLIAIPSVNPSGDPGTPHTGEAAIAGYLQKWTARAGAATRLDPVLPGRPNLLAVWKPKGLRKPAARIWFAPHTDTVSVAGMTVAPFDPVVRAGKITGRGASDTKGSIAAMLTAIDAWWREGGKRGDIEVGFAGLMGEEAGNDGARALAARADFRADLVVVGEPTGLKVAAAHKGALWFELHATGRACHASTPERGRNAIDAMAAALAALREGLPPFLARKPHPLLGPATYNAGTIRGGSKVNIVPDRCVAEIDVRVTPACPDKAVLAEVRRLVAPFGVTIAAARLNPGLATDPELPLVRRLREFAHGDGAPIGVPWFCDAAIFARRGFPAVAFGPGSIDQAHTRDEFLRVADLENGANACLAFLKSF